MARPQVADGGEYLEVWTAILNMLSGAGVTIDGNSIGDWIYPPLKSHNYK
jgi:hypothetical protein